MYKWWVQRGGLSWKCLGLSVCLSVCVREPEGWELSVPCVCCAPDGAGGSRLWGAGPKEPGVAAGGDLPTPDMAGGGVCRACARLMGWDPCAGFFPSLSPGPLDAPTGQAAAGESRGVSPLSLQENSPSSWWDLISCSRTPRHARGTAGAEGCGQQRHPESPRYLLE